MGRVLVSARARSVDGQLPGINAPTLDCGSSQIGDRVVSCEWLVPNSRGFGGKLQSNGIFGEGARLNEVLVDRRDEQLECNGEFLRIAVSNKVGQVRAEGRQDVVLLEIEPATHAEQNVRFSGKRERRGFLEDLEGDVLRDVLIDERDVSEEDRYDLAFAA
jgi:hypothetical protein